MNKISTSEIANHEEAMSSVLGLRVAQTPATRRRAVRRV
jgi:hypothetical protein